MNLTVMNFNRIRDLVLNLGIKADNNEGYVPRKDCLAALEKLEDELLNEDKVNRNVRITLHICGTVQKDLLPILSSKVDTKLIAVATRILVNLSLPVEYLISHQKLPSTPRIKRVHKHLFACSLDLKKAFLNVSATLALVTILRETLIKSEKQLVPLNDEDCKHLKKCLLLLRNILHLPDFNAMGDEHSISTFNNLQSIQSKLIWNLFVQGIDGALLLMLNSKCRKQWTVPFAIILGSLYQNQNIDDVHQTLELISSASEDSEDEQESDGSKNSYNSLSSDPSKNMDVFSDSAYPLTADEPFPFKRENRNFGQSKCGISKYVYTVPEIRTDLEKVQISDDSGRTHQNHQSNCFKDDPNGKLKVALSLDGINYGDSSPCVSPYHKRIRGNPIPPLKEVHEIQKCKRDSGISECYLSSDMMDSKSSDDDVFDAKPEKQTKMVQHHRSLQLNCKMSESDSSNEDVQNKKIKYRCHPPNVKRSKNSKRSIGCSPSVCMDSALEVLYSKGKIRYPLWEKRNSVSTLVGINSSTPSNDDIGNLLKEFTLSFLHSGFSKLVLDLKDLFLKGQHLDIDKSVLFWVVGYFLPLTTAANICLDHIREVISADVIGVLVFECVNVCETAEIHAHNEKIVQYVTVQMKLLTIALKEVLSTIDSYSQKCNTPKDRALFNKLNGKLAGLQDLRNLPLLLLQIYPLINNQHFLEDVALLNHQILILIGRGVDHCCEPKKINFISHLRFELLNDCVFTMLHHLSGDICSFELLFVPSILKAFSDILQEEFELEQYQEDLIMFVLNKFAFKTGQDALKKQKGKDVAACNLSSDDLSNYSCVGSYDSLPSEDDDLYWWYLQFEQDKDPISRIAEHISKTKPDILFKLKLKGFISLDKYKQLAEVMEEADRKIVDIPSIKFKEMPNFDEDITNLLKTLVHDKQRHHLLWVQDILLETCYVKQGLEKKLPEPVPFYSIKMMLSVPLVPYSEDQRNILQDETFVLLLQKLGLHIGSGACQMYPRIPLYWTTDMLFSIACRLGPITKDELKFTYEDLELSNSNFELDVSKNDECSVLPPLSSCCTLSSWLTAVQQSKDIYRTKQHVNAFKSIS